MTMRTIRKAVTFSRPFILGESDEVFPAGIYDVETNESLIEGLSFIAYRRLATFVHLHPQAGCTRTMTIAPVAFDEALARDVAGNTRGVEQ
ncbi:MAG: hypothetical protein WC284_18170 [Candidimonas sp.]